MSGTPTAAIVTEPVSIGLIVGDWLPISETFIYDQIRHQLRTRCLVCAQRRTTEGNLFPYREVKTLTWWERKLHKRLSAPPSWKHLLRKHGARLIHAHFGTNGARTLELATQLDIPLAVNFHGHDVGGLELRHQQNSRYYYYQKYGRRLFEQAALLLCPSTDVAESLIAEHGAPANKVVVHRLGVDLERFTFVERSGSVRRLLMVGRLVEKKGMDIGLRAMAELISGYPDLIMTIIGDGPLSDTLKALAANLGLATRVRFTGALSTEQVSAEMRHADVLLAPSYRTASGDRESGLIVAKEAAATGVPAIGTRHGGIPEIIDHERSGFLVPERDVKETAARLRELIADETTCRTFGRNAAEKMRREYDTRVQNAKLEELLLGLI